VISERQQALISKVTDIFAILIGKKHVMVFPELALIAAQ
jgi:hypothetical protein